MSNENENTSEKSKTKSNINVKLSQPGHNGTGPVYVGSGMYFGIAFEQVGEELIANVSEEDIASLLDAKKVKKVSAAVLKELKAEAEEA